MSRCTCRTSDYFLPVLKNTFPVKRAIPLIHERTAMYDIDDNCQMLRRL